MTVEHVAGIAVRNPQMVAFSRHYAVTVHTCELADPATKGGSESTVKLAKADLVPKDTNLLPAYASFVELEAACEVFCQEVNARVHRVTRRPLIEMLAEERARLHPVPEHPHTVAFGLTRTVPASMPMVSFDSGQYSVPHTLLGETVWVRVHGRGVDEQVVIVHAVRADPSRSPDTDAPHRVPRKCSMTTSRHPQQGPWTDAPRRRTPPTWSSSTSARAPTCG